MDYDYTIIFKKLEESKDELGLDKESHDGHDQKDETGEANEISELRKIVLEITESESNSYTTA